jgi:U3 small nucleolar RNA-associated protein 21
MQTFSPFRLIGNVCSDVPIAYTTLYDEPVLMVATGRTFQLYRGKELSMLRGGPTFENPVTAVSQSGRFRFVGEGAMIHAFSHHKRLWSLPHAEVTLSPVLHLLARDDLLFSTGADKMLVVRLAKTGEVVNTIPINGSPDVTVLCLLEGYTNKILLGTAQGSLLLYNFRSGKLLFEETVEAASSLRSSPGRVLCVASSVYRDVIAFGTSSGRLVVYNIGTAQEIATFQHDDVAVTSVAFRTDKDGFVVTGTSAGEIVVWNLHERCLDGVLTRSKEVKSRNEAFDTPHTEPVHSLQFFPKGAMLVSGASDNAIMQFRFDTVDGLGLLVRERRGHMGACSCVTFYNSDLILTAGYDRALRATHVFSDRASWEMSQGKLGRRGRDEMVSREALKLPTVAAIHATPTRNYQWASVVTLHEASAQMCTWRMDTRAMETKMSGIATGSNCARCVTTSGCGNYAVVGYSSGHVCVIHLQNKSIKHCFLDAKTAKEAHRASVESVQIAAGNSTVVSAGLDRVIHLWELATQKHLKQIAVPHELSHSCLHEPSSLLVVAMSDHVLRVYNVNPNNTEDNQKPVRVFVGHQASITALALTPDTLRHVVSASADGVLMVSDLSAGVCVGYHRLPAPATSLAFHPDALFLATTHMGERGAFLWSNNLRYGYAPEVVSNPLSIDIETLPLLHFPIACGEKSDEPADEQQAAVERAKNAHDAKSQELKKKLEKRNDEARETELFDASLDVGLLRRKQDEARMQRLNELHQLDELQLSGLPRSTWYNITLIDQIKEKNQPLLPPKKKDVPFFLPTTSELRPTFIVQAEKEREHRATAASKAANASVDEVLAGHVFDKAEFLFTLSPIAQDMVTGQYGSAMTKLKALPSASEIDLELRQMIQFNDDRDVEQTADELARATVAAVALLNFLRHHIEAKQEVDLVQGMILSVLKAHGVTLTSLGSEVVEALEMLMRSQQHVMRQLDHLVNFPTCIVGTVTGSVV